MGYEFRPAVRSDTKPLIGLYGQSGSGKTYSALLLARGMVGANGRIGMIDTESGRGSLYADVLPGGYEVMTLGDPFTPKRYIEALTAAEDAGFDVVIIDSASHEWEGIGGVLDMAGDIEQRTGKPGLHCWKEPKLEHGRFVLKLLQAKVPVILCLRAKFKSRQVKNERGKNEIVKDDHTSPQQADDFIFEMTAHAEVLLDHTINLTKCSHPDLRACFPAQGPLKIEHGEKIAAWSRGAAKPAEVTAAEEAASQGTEAFTRWWNSPQGKASRAITRSHLTRLQQIARDADAGAAANEDNEDPFTGASAKPTPAHTSDGNSDLAHEEPHGQEDPDPSGDPGHGAERGRGDMLGETALDMFKRELASKKGQQQVEAYIAKHADWVATLDGDEAAEADDAIAAVREGYAS